MNKAILDIDVQAFIQANLNADVARISLSKSPFSAVSSKHIAQQIEGKKRSEVKLPLWFQTPGIYFPEKLALEQCSSEATAEYKSDLTAGDKLIDITGGFGVDAVFFAQKKVQVTSCELNAELSSISNHNSQVLGLNIKHVASDGLEYLKNSYDTYSTLYVDPSRRVNSRKVFMLKDCEPDIIENLELLSMKSNRIIVKTAPLLDIQSTIKELGTVSAIHVLSLKNECKEVLYLVDRNSNERDPPITCAVLGNEETRTFTFRASEEKQFIIESFSKPLKYFYEPDVSLLKAGCFKLITREFQIRKLHKHTHLYTSDDLQGNFLGRIFRILDTWDYGHFIKKHSFAKANIICRNFPQNANKVRKKLRIADGGNDYLLFCTGPANELLVVHCDRIF